MPVLSPTTVHIPNGTQRQLLFTVKEAEHRLDITVSDGATLDIVCIQDAPADATVRINHQSTLGTNAKIHWYNVDLGGCAVEHNLVSRIEGEGSRSDIDWIFFAKDTEKYVLSAKNIFNAKEGEGEITVRGIAQGHAQTKFDGMIEITENGGGTNTYLSENILMLDHTAKVDAVPGLEIKTNDVKASHSAAVTKVSEEDLFYFASRGIAEGESRKMFIEGFLGSLIQNLSQKNIQQMVQESIASKYST